MGQSNSIHQNTPICGKAKILSKCDNQEECSLIYSNEMLKYMKEVKYFIDNISKDSLVIYIDGENIVWTK
jgi:hypothetical protein